MIQSTETRSWSVGNFSLTLTNRKMVVSIPSNTRSQHNSEITDINTNVHLEEPGRKPVSHGYLLTNGSESGKEQVPFTSSDQTAIVRLGSIILNFLISEFKKQVK